jgi:stearoyl-CoA desaturase (delta-9 desaturase)
MGGPPQADAARLADGFGGHPVIPSSGGDVKTDELDRPHENAMAATEPDVAQRPHWYQQLFTGLVVVAPLMALVWAADRFWHRGVGWFDLGFGIALYVATGFGVTLGFHRLFTHRSFRARRWLRVTLAVAGSMAVEGSVISWVSHHRRHHLYADRPGDPHSPVADTTRSFGHLRGFLHAHVGWLFSGATSDATRWSRDLLADRDLVVVSTLTPLWMALSFALPFGVGWAVTRSITGALLALLWAGAVRVALLHHMTWSVNSLGHMFGKRPYKSPDRSGNISVLAVVSLGDSWHNSHHAFPTIARHGCNPGQVDPTAALLRIFERLGWASQVRWPRPEVLVRRLAS